MEQPPSAALPPLPKPDSSALRKLVSDANTREIYALLYRRRDSPPTMVEVRAYMTDLVGESHSQVDRRLRALRERGLDIPVLRDGRESRYLLKGWRPGGPREPAPAISAKLRAQVLAPQRCAQCGHTPLDHGVVLVVDHKVPQAWGGGNELENLQPLCEECNGGKRDFFETYDAYGDLIRSAINHDEVHRRIGELLKAFEGQWVYTELIGIVASTQAFQEDYQKRLRELRVLGWVIDVEKRYNEGARVRTYYRCTESKPWPGTVSIIGEIRRIEATRKTAKKATGSS